MQFDQSLRFPKSLEVLEIPFYKFNWNRDDSEITDDRYLYLVLKSRKFPNLREVHIPFGPIDWFGREAQQDLSRKSWEEGRAELEASDIFKGGQVKLRKWKLGEKSQFCILSNLEL